MRRKKERGETLFTIGRKGRKGGKDESLFGGKGGGGGKETEISSIWLRKKKGKKKDSSWALGGSGRAGRGRKGARMIITIFRRIQIDGGQEKEEG